MQIYVRDAIIGKTGFSGTTFATICNYTGKVLFCYLYVAEHTAVFEG